MIVARATLARVDGGRGRALFVCRPTIAGTKKAVGMGENGDESTSVDVDTQGRSIVGTGARR